MSSQHVTVFGGTGFFGRHIVRRLLDADLAVRIPSRHPDRAHSLFSRDVSGIESVYANVNDDGSVAAGVAGAWGVVNAVSLYVERGKSTFHSIHVEGAKRIAMLARQAGSETLVHVSGIGADAGSTSPYIRSRGEGEAAVLDSFPSAKYCAINVRKVREGAGVILINEAFRPSRDRDRSYILASDQPGTALIG